MKKDEQKENCIDEPFSQYFCLDPPQEHTGLARVVKRVEDPDTIFESRIGLLHLMVTAYQIANYWSEDPPSITLIEETFKLKEVLLPRQRELLEDRLAQWSAKVNELNHSCQKRGTQRLSGLGEGMRDWLYTSNPDQRRTLAPGLSMELQVKEELPHVTGLFPDGIMLSGTAQLSIKVQADNTLDFHSRMELAYKKGASQEYCAILLDRAVKETVEREERLELWLPLGPSDLLDIGASREPWTHARDFPRMYMQGTWTKHVPRMLRAPDNAPRVISAPDSFEDTLWYLVPDIVKVGEAMSERKARSDHSLNSIIPSK